MSIEEREEHERQIESNKREAAVESRERERKAKEQEGSRKAKVQLKIRGTAAGTCDVRMKEEESSTANAATSDTIRYVDESTSSSWKQGGPAATAVSIPARQNAGFGGTAHMHKLKTGGEAKSSQDNAGRN